jgi:hypothetical protein
LTASVALGGGGIDLQPSNEGDEAEEVQTPWRSNENGRVRYLPVSPGVRDRTWGYQFRPELDGQIVVARNDRTSLSPMDFATLSVSVIQQQQQQLQNQQAQIDQLMSLVAELTGSNER